MSQFGVDDPLINVNDCILCWFCETRVAFIEHFVPNAKDLVYGGYIERMFHYTEHKRPHDYEEQRGGNTLNPIYCCQCTTRLGWQLVKTTRRSRYFVVGRFFVKLELLVYQNGQTLHDAVFGVANEQAPNEQDLGTNADQDGGAKADQNEDAKADQNGGANEHNADQDRDANEQNPDQDGGRPMKRRRRRPKSE